MLTNNQTSADAKALPQLQEQLSAWRQGQKSPRPLPEKLWAQAADLARKLGVGEVARALQLQPAALKRRMAAAPTASPSSSMSFLELLPPTMGARIGECAMELESTQGTLLRVALKDVDPLELASLLRSLMRDGL